MPVKITKDTSDGMILRLALMQWQLVEKEVLEYAGNQRLKAVWKNAKTCLPKSAIWAKSCAFCERADKEARLPDGELDCQNYCAGISLGLFEDAPFACEQTDNYYRKLLQSNNAYSVKLFMRKIIEELEERLNALKEVKDES